MSSARRSRAALDAIVIGRERVALAGAVLLSIAGAAPVARAAGACPDKWEAGAGPLPAGIGPADFGAIPEACPASELMVRARGSLLVASGGPDFYGNATADLMLRARRTVGARTWLSLALDVVTFRYVANAVVTSDGFAFGPPTLGIYRALGTFPDLSLALYGRALLPPDTARKGSVQVGIEAGGAARLRLRPRLGVEGGLGVTAPFVVVAGQVHAALQPAALAEAWWAPRSYLALFAGAEGRFRAAPDPSFTSIAPRAAARFSLRRGFSLAALVAVPVAGADRTDVVAALYAGWAAP